MKYSKSSPLWHIERITLLEKVVVVVVVVGMKVMVAINAKTDLKVADGASGAIIGIALDGRGPG